MARYAATPGEFDRLIDFLEPVDRKHHAAIARMVFLEVATCPRCELPIRRCDTRRLVGDRLHHLTCAGGSVGEGPPAPPSVSYEPGCDCRVYLPLTDLYGKPLTAEVLGEATSRIMASMTAELEVLRGEKAPPVRYDPRAHRATPTGKPRPLEEAS